MYSTFCVLVKISCILMCKYLKVTITGTPPGSVYLMVAIKEHLYKKKKKKKFMLYFLFNFYIFISCLLNFLIACFNDLLKNFILLYAHVKVYLFI